jgi:hypothetical protein
MKQSNFTAYAFTSILSVLAAYVIGIGQTLDSYSYVLDDDQYAACGLNKLSSEELTNLFAFMERIPRVSYLEESAVHTLQRDDWKIAQVYGIQKLIAGNSTAEEEYLVCVIDQRVQILDLPLFTDRLSPGSYWAKISGSTLLVLHPSGEEERYWIAETRD